MQNPIGSDCMILWSRSSFMKYLIIFRDFIHDRHVFVERNSKIVKSIGILTTPNTYNMFLSKCQPSIWVPKSYLKQYINIVRFLSRIQPKITTIFGMRF